MPFRFPQTSALDVGECLVALPLESLLLVVLLPVANVLYLLMLPLAIKWLVVGTFVRGTFPLWGGVHL